MQGIRRKFHWVAAITDAVTGETMEVPFETFWSPEHDPDTAGLEVANAAAAMQTVSVENKRKANNPNDIHKWLPMGAYQVEVTA